MSALAHQLPAQLRPARAPQLVLLPTYEVPVRPAAVVFWKRRLAAIVVLSILVVGAWSLLSMGAGLISSQSSAPAAATAGLVGASPASQSTYTVRPGDTLWSIARSIKPTGDIRTVLNPLMKQYSGQPLQPGQTLALPAFKP